MKLVFPFSNCKLPAFYGMNAPEQQQLNHVNQHSFPFTVTDIPVNGQSLAWSLIDFDTVPILGFPLIHWVVANVPVTSTEMLIPADFSLQTELPQGFNSLHSPLQYLRQPWWHFKTQRQSLETHYFGPRPRSGTHNYYFTVMAFDGLLDLPQPYDLANLMTNHPQQLVANVSVNLTYRNQKKA